jgi:hypothetical protein
MFRLYRISRIRWTDSRISKKVNRLLKLYQYMLLMMRIVCRSYLDQLPLEIMLSSIVNLEFFDLFWRTDVVHDVVYDLSRR